jgi:hypothetical protein
MSKCLGVKPEKLKLIRNKRKKHASSKQQREHPANSRQAAIKQLKVKVPKVRKHSVLGHKLPKHNNNVHDNVLLRQRKSKQMI